jgi:CRP-like cAMP-binding protein
MKPAAEYMASVKRAASTSLTAAGPRPENKLLKCLPEEDFRRLAPSARVIELTPKLVIQPIHEPIHEVVFPDGGVVSVTTSMLDGSIVEVATIGAEGFVGINALFAGATADAASMVQVPGATATVLPASVFRREIERPGPFRDCVQRYSQGLIGLMIQSSACLALHAVEQRCCRWLLMAHDRVGRDEFHLSQEFLAAMLGSTRPTVNVVASALQKSGAIKYVHGRMVILDRRELERGSCECYRTVGNLFTRLGLQLRSVVSSKVALQASSEARA